MELSLFLAQAWGLYLLIMGAVLLVNKKSQRRLMNLVDDDNFLFTVAFLALVIGILSVLAHNIWEANWVGLVTLLGWGALIKGIVYMAAPEVAGSWKKRLKDNPGLLNVGLLVALVAGAYLVYVGFFA